MSALNMSLPTQDVHNAEKINKYVPLPALEF